MFFVSQQYIQICRLYVQHRVTRYTYMSSLLCWGGRTDGSRLATIGKKAAEPVTTALD